MSEGANSGFLAGLDKALLIALATPIAYLYAFNYDCGYLDFFGVPNILVDVSLRDLLIAASAALSLVFSLYWFFDPVLTLLPEKWPLRIQRRAIGIICVAVLLYMLLRVNDASRVAWYVLLASIVAISCLLVALPLYRQKKTGTPEATDQPPRIDPLAHKGLLPLLRQRGVNPDLILLAFLAYVGYHGAFLIGDARATMQTSFMVHQSDNGDLCAVIRMRDADFLCADFNMATRQVTGNYQFLKPETTKLSLQYTGRLHRVEMTKTPQAIK